MNLPVQTMRRRAGEAEASEILKASMEMLKYYALNLGRYSKAVKAIGYQLGLDIVANQISSTGVDAVVEDLGDYWAKNEIGEISWQNREDQILMMRSHPGPDKLLHNRQHALCLCKEGLLEAVLKVKTGRKFEVKEIECSGAESPNCVFRIMSRRDGFKERSVERA